MQASLSAALDKARLELGAHGNDDGVICVTGSLYAVSASLRAMGSIQA
jgi:hypothetical protein